MFCFAPYMMAPIDAANADHAGARALGEANNIPGMRDRIAGVTVAIGEGATYLKQRLNDANGDWSAVVVDARRELHAIAAPHLQMLPDDPFKCAVALKELDATVARELATRRATSAMDTSGEPSPVLRQGESTPPSSTRSLDPAAASPLDSPVIPAGALPTVAAAPRASSDVRSPPRKKQWRGHSDAAPAQPPAAQTAPGPTPAAPAQLQAQNAAAAAATPAATAPSAATSPNPAAWAWRSASGGL